jgi:tRNA (cytidine32/uridine32-2'-O)-methyltransferase
MKLDNIRIVLVETSHPGNIGSSARAMKNMGLKNLYLVSPQHFPDKHANELAAGADDVLEQAIICNTLAEAIQDCHLIYATSARPREIALPGFLPTECAKHIASHTDDTNIAIVFGREKSGLSNQELMQCNYHVNIPSNPEFSSLNLSQSVQIIAYELRMQILAPKAQVLTRQDQYAKAQDLELFYEHLYTVLVAIDFINPSHPKRLMQRLRRMFNRTNLETMEVNLLRGILTQIQHKRES